MEVIERLIEITPPQSAAH